jgi:hypothetical protein
MPGYASKVANRAANKTLAAIQNPPYVTEYFKVKVENGYSLIYIAMTYYSAIMSTERLPCSDPLRVSLLRLSLAGRLCGFHRNFI